MPTADLSSSEFFNSGLDSNLIKMTQEFLSLNSRVAAAEQWATFPEQCYEQQTKNEAPAYAPHTMASWADEVEAHQTLCLKVLGGLQFLSIS